MPRPIFAKLNLLMIPYDHNPNLLFKIFHIFYHFGHVKTRAAVGRRKEHKVWAKEGVQIGANNKMIPP